MARSKAEEPGAASARLMALYRAIAARAHSDVLQLLAAQPDLAEQVMATGATRQASSNYFLADIAHYVYAGDTALHIAAAAHDRGIVRKLLTLGASVSARNRRGAEPLHYAVDGGPGASGWDAADQAATIAELIDAGADPNVVDKSGVTPLHRAVRTRCALAVATLLASGADVHRSNGSGSTPLHLAVQNTGRGGTGSMAACEQQKAIIQLLLDHGARPGDRNGLGKTVIECISSDWIREAIKSR